MSEMRVTYVASQCVVLPQLVHLRLDGKLVSCRVLRVDGRIIPPRIHSDQLVCIKHSSTHVGAL